MILINPKKIQSIEVLKNLDSFKDILHEDGLILLEGLNNERALTIAKALGEIFHHKDSDKEGIVHLSVITEDKWGENVRGFSSEALYPHTDRSVERFPPDVVMLWCNHAAKSGGESLLADGKQICATLLKNSASSFHKLMESNTAIFKSEGREYSGAIIETIADNRVCIRFRNDELGFFCGEVLEALIDLKKAIVECTQKIKLTQGEGYIAQNTRWLHGRTKISGARSFGRIHVNLINEDGTVYRGFSIA